MQQNTNIGSDQQDLKAKKRRAAQTARLFTLQFQLIFR